MEGQHVGADSKSEVSSENRTCIRWGTASANTVLAVMATPLKPPVMKRHSMAASRLDVMP